eukprot:767228-Hanusia_phi.AAC.6
MQPLLSQSTICRHSDPLTTRVNTSGALDSSRRRSCGAPVGLALARRLLRHLTCCQILQRMLDPPLRQPLVAPVGLGVGLLEQRQPHDPLRPHVLVSERPLRVHSRGEEKSPRVLLRGESAGEFEE